MSFILFIDKIQSQKVISGDIVRQKIRLEIKIIFF